MQRTSIVYLRQINWSITPHDQNVEGYGCLIKVQQYQNATQPVLIGTTSTIRYVVRVNQR